MIPPGCICECAQELASDPLRDGLALRWESEGVSTQKSIRPSPADYVGSYSSDMVSNRRYGDYPGGGILGPNRCVLIGSDGGRSVGQ